MQNLMKWLDQGIWLSVNLMVGHVNIFLSLYINCMLKNRAIECLYCIDVLVHVSRSPLPPMSDQDRVSPYTINTISRRPVLGLFRKISIKR